MTGLNGEQKRFLSLVGREKPPHLCGGRSALALCKRVSPLITRFPGFPVQLVGAGALLAAFRKRKPHTRSRPVQRTGNPGLALVSQCHNNARTNWEPAGKCWRREGDSNPR